MIVRPKTAFRNSGHAHKTVRAETHLEYHRYERVDVPGFVLPSLSSQRTDGHIPNPLLVLYPSDMWPFPAEAQGSADVQQPHEGTMKEP